MTEAEARAAAGAERGARGVPDDAADGPAELRHIEVADLRDPARPVVRDVAAWVVRYLTGAGWIDLAVDDRAGGIVRVERSRGAPGGGDSAPAAPPPDGVPSGLPPRSMTPTTPTPAETALWRILEQRLESQGAYEALAHVRRLLGTRVESVSAQGAHRRFSIELRQRISDYEARYETVSGERASWFFSALAEDRGRAIGDEAALDAARAAADLPADAVLETSGWEEQVGEPVFVARWVHRVEGLPVERDSILVQVNGNSGKAFAVHRKWHTLDPAGAPR